MSLKNSDLTGTILPSVLVDGFEPKAGLGKDVIVVAFYLIDKPPAEDLNTFIQRGVIDTLDVEVSLNTDDDGHYLVFVEMSRNDTFPNKFRALLKDVLNVAGEVEWKIKTFYTGDTEFDINDPALYDSMMLDPKQYMLKDKLSDADKLKEHITAFFKNSLVSDLTIDGSLVILTHNRKKIIAEVVDIGSYDEVIGRNLLEESAFNVTQIPYEAQILSSILGNCNILPIGKYLCVSKDTEIMLLSNTELKYGA